MVLVSSDLARREGPDRRKALRDVVLRALVPGLVLWWPKPASGSRSKGRLWAGTSPGRFESRTRAPGSRCGTRLQGDRMGIIRQ